MSFTPYTPQNHVIGLQLAISHAVNSNSFTLKTGQGSQINASNLPTRLLAITAATYGQGPAEQFTIYPLTAISGDVLTVGAAIEGTTDQIFQIGDYIDLRFTEGYIADLNTAVTGLEGNFPVSNANLANDSITITAGTNLSGGGTVSLGGSVTLNATGGGDSISLTTTGSSGAATLSGSTLNVPNYAVAPNVPLAISAASGGQSGATAISAPTYFGQRTYQVVSTVGAGAGVALPVPTAGMSITVINTGANPLLVYPANGGSAGINGNTSTTAITIEVGLAVTFDATTSTTWVSSYLGLNSQSFSANASSQTWIKPIDPHLNYARVIMFGPGGAGGGGGYAASGTAICGGGGGSGGAYTDEIFLLSGLPSTVTVTVPIAGTGGAGISSAGTGNNGGTQNSNTTFGAYAQADRGAPGNGGSTSSGTGGSAFTGCVWNGGSGGSSSESAAPSPAATVSRGGSGGGAGGGWGTSTAYAGGSSGQITAYYGQPSPAVGTAGSSSVAGGAGTAGTSATSATGAPCSATGGTGGGAGLGGGNGGNGGTYGGGGGGGGASQGSSGTSGDGGNGGPGFCLVMCF